MLTGHSVPIEFEGKILDIDPDNTEQLIVDTGGHKLGERFMRRYVYDITPATSPSGSGCANPATTSP